MVQIHSIMEVAAVALVAEQAISTVIEGGVIAGIALRQPTLPLKAVLACVGSVPDEATVYVTSTSKRLGAFRIG